MINKLIITMINKLDTFLTNIIKFINSLFKKFNSKQNTTC